MKERKFTCSELDVSSIYILLQLNMDFVMFLTFLMSVTFNVSYNSMINIWQMKEKKMIKLQKKTHNFTSTLED